MPRSPLFAAAALGLAALAVLAAPPSAHAIVVDLGSDGSDGALNVTSDTVVPLPDDGVLHYTSVTIASGATLSFSYAGTFHPGVVLLATGDVVIDGTLDVSGMDAGTDGIRYGGPGGTAGGQPGPSSGGHYARNVIAYSLSGSLREVGGSGGQGQRSGGACFNPTMRGAGGGGVVHILANGVIRGSGSIDAAGGTVPGDGIAGTDCTTGNSTAARPGGDGKVWLMTPRLEGGGLTVVATHTRVSAFDRVDDPTTSQNNLLTDSNVRPWTPEPTIEITQVDGVDVDAGTLYALPAGSDETVDVAVRVVGCTGSSITVYVQGWAGGPAGVQDTGTVSAPTGDDTLTVATGPFPTGSTVQLRVAYRCYP